MSANNVSKKTVNNIRIPWSHLVPVPEQYQELGCRIEDTAQRGMTLPMLEELFNLIQQVLDAGYEIIDQHSGKAVTVDTINLYHIDEHFVKPLTKKDQCSFVELAISQDYVKKMEKKGFSTAPTFFVSHWWGTPLVDTIRMLKLHEHGTETFWDALKGEARDYSVWICAFANRQHNLEKEGLDSGGHLETPFARVIRSDNCQGTVLLLNENDATPLRRSWCIFEAFVSLTQCEQKKKRHRMEIATIIPEGAYVSPEGNKSVRCAGLLSETHIFSRSGGDRVGFMSSDHDDKDSGSHAPPSIFPPDLLLRGLRVNIREAEATQLRDQERIDTWVGERADEVNLAFRKKFFGPGLVSACKQRDPGMLNEALVLGSSFLSSEEIQKYIDDFIIIFNLLMDPAQFDVEISRCIKVLMEHGWDQNRPILTSSSRNGSRPIWYALSQKQYETARVLLQGGADLSKYRVAGLSIIDYAECPEDIREVLKKEGLIWKGRCARAFFPCFRLRYFKYFYSCCFFCLHPHEAKVLWRKTQRSTV